MASIPITLPPTPVKNELPPGSPYLGDPIGISAFADMQATAANNYILSLSALTTSLTPPVINPEFPTGGSAPAVEIPTVPAFAQPVWTAPSLPADFTEVLDIGDLAVEPFDADPPALIIGSPPTAFTDPAPDAPGINLDFTDPTLSVSLPDPPDLLAISIATFNGLNLPTFSAADPVLTAVEPTIREYTPGAQYTSSLLTALRASLESRITTGGTGLNQDVENAIWDRGREREARSARDAQADLDRMEALGFAFPPGAWLDARIRIATEMDYVNRGHSREVMIKSAELELDNVKHALSTATEIESQMLNYSNAVEQRLFEATKYATEAGIAIYNAKVQAYASLVEVYRTKVQIYDAQIRAEVSKVDAYRAQVEAERAKAETNTAIVEQYKVRADVALSAVEIYKAQIAGIQAKAEIEQAKVAVFGEQVRAYVARINAYTAGVEGFRATIEAETAKQTAYRSQVEAFSALVDAASKQIEARIDAYKGRIEASNARWEGYKAQASAESARVQSLAAINNAEAEAYKAEVSAVASYNDVLTKQWQATLDQNQQVANIAINAAKANADLYVTVRGLAIEAAKTGAQVSSQLGAAAINAINWSTSYGFNTSNSYSASNSASVEAGINTSYNYNFSE